jgi:hypothetical protein
MRVLNGDYVTIVSGLPRSGTSLMMQMLAAGGIPALTDNLRPADESNPRGYFEFEPVKRLRSDRSWLDQARGHAVKIIHVLVRELPADGRFHYRLVLMKRPIEEILAPRQDQRGRSNSGKDFPDSARPVGKMVGSATGLFIFGGRLPSRAERAARSCQRSGPAKLPMECRWQL